jgi:flagellin-like hook-associated protein FlgL
VNDLISISLGNGNGTFGPRITYSQQNPSRLLVEDFNEDGTLDLLVGSNGGDTQVRLGNGNGTFAAGTLLLAGGSVARGGATITDYNNDGHLDVVAADNNGSQISIYCGNGNGTFASAITISTISNPVALLASDLDGDGVVDLVATSDSASQMKVHVAVSTATSTTTTSILPVSLSTQTRAEDTLNVLDSALGYLNSTRADIGATLSRLAFAANNSQNAIESISAARSQIMDADIAETLAEFSKLQILQKVGIAVLGQANLNQQATLRLLQNI